MRVGQKYKLVRHPHTPIGTITEVDATMDLVTVEWDNNSNGEIPFGSVLEWCF